MPKRTGARVNADVLSGLTHVEVWNQSRRVGTLAQPDPRSACLFEYDEAWMRDGFAIAPYSLELRQGVMAPPNAGIGGLHGIFADSLPGDWGQLLVERRLAELGIDASRLGPLERLSIVGANGPGALEYRPVFAAQREGSKQAEEDFDKLALQCQAILDDKDADDIDRLYARGGSSGGARPKMEIWLDGSPWFVKFPTREDGLSAGADEYRLMLLAKECGIIVPEVCLIPSEVCPGFFATKRFDCVRLSDGSLSRVYMASAAALLEKSPFDSSDYRELMALCFDLTRDVRDCEQLYLVMCFNVLVGNQDDHLKNFSFLYDEAERAWHLSPAYDLTRVQGFLGEHATLVNGKGTAITQDDLVSVGKSGGISARKCRELLGVVRDVTSVV